MYDFSPILLRLKEAKKRSGMTNEELSAASGVPVGTLKKIFSGDTKEPKLPALMSIASALDTSVDYLVYGISPYAEKKPASEEDGLDELIFMYRSLTVDNRSKLLELCRLYLGAQNKN